MRIYNTATRKKEELVPGPGGRIGIYACGPTVYNFIHLGNARPLVIYDVLRRYLIWRGYAVTYVQNFTDIDDKMINRARSEGVTVPEIARRFIDEYWKDAEGLGVCRADIHPRATEHIGEIIGLIRRLEKKGLAYASGDGVYFDTAAHEDYGRLSGQNPDDLMAGARVDESEQKKNPMDFALWKFEKPGEPSWDSPWGKGRPGWHIECSAMAMKYLGETVDIHCGGADLVFPHHENETAQSEGATGKPFVRYWMHNGFISVDNQKMSKSRGNFFTIREIAEKYPLEAVRFFLLSAHYRSPINYSEDQLAQAQAALARLYSARDNWVASAAGQMACDRSVSEQMASLVSATRQRFIDAMDDDLNTADALAALFALVREVNTLNSAEPSYADSAAALGALEELCGVLGILVRKAQLEMSAHVQALVDARAAARADKNWAESDRLREELARLGYIVEDTREGQKLRKA
ncbi:MAG: cysteine--tRNA ligase [Christensenellales bacterium]|jgi:cysteinyl-tRNA synthetase